VEPDNIQNKSFLDPGVIAHLSDLNQHASDADYFVVDSVLQSEALQHFSSLLLHSTVWFDLTNGFAFCTHHDDGLHFSSITSLAQVSFLLICPPFDNKNSG
jgi:hypothetical protein